MYGIHHQPFDEMIEELHITFKKIDGSLHYFRQFKENSIEKNIITDDDRILISPVEPLNLPKQLTSTLLVEFDNQIIIEPKKKQTIYLTFPIEIGVFLPLDKENRTIDIIGLSKAKFTLYGDVKTGNICKYWSSEIYDSIPATDPLHEGVLELKIYNSSTKWLEVSKTVFTAYGMKIYYKDDLVSLKGTIKIKDEDLSETNFLDKPLEKYMEKAPEIYQTKKQPLKGSKFVMEGGL